MNKRYSTLFRYQVPIYICQLHLLKMRINDVILKPMFQLHNSANKINSSKMLFNYIKLNIMISVAKIRYKFRFITIYIQNKLRLNICKSRLSS